LEIGRARPNHIDKSKWTNKQDGVTALNFCGMSAMLSCYCSTDSPSPHTTHVQYNAAAERKLVGRSRALHKIQKQSPGGAMRVRSKHLSANLQTQCFDTHSLGVAVVSNSHSAVSIWAVTSLHYITLHNCV